MVVKSSPDPREAVVSIIVVVVDVVIVFVNLNVVSAILRKM